jgi:putative hydrolase of the HAD superfamily
MDRVSADAGHEGATIRCVLFDFGETLVERVNDELQPLDELTITAFSDAAPTLERLRQDGYRMAIVSNTSQSGERHMLAALQVLGFAGYFDAIVTSFEAGAEKPSPLIYDLALQRLGCTRAEAAMVGNDPLTDIQGAAALGMITVLVARDVDHAQGPGAPATFTVGSLREVPGLLQPAGVDRTDPA